MSERLECGCEVTSEQTKPLTYLDLAERVVSLEAQVTRLQRYIKRTTGMDETSEFIRDLHDGDLDPLKETKE